MNLNNKEQIQYDVKMDELESALFSVTKFSDTEKNIKTLEIKKPSDQIHPVTSRALESDCMIIYFISTIALSTKAFFVLSSQKSSNILLPSPIFSNKSCPLYISISCENQQSCFAKHIS